ncbi:MAG: hypothetical protein ACD_3C00236G0002 [uncultured bacterium (gcode 4)]|uniref:Fibrobacter succinogenes major paralogous domain-containing protein n=1 Tax=uncultured bacterium (gcode 4) TaxID=1234023 RepID=K2GVA3_9BACT|nr:MAG: hypothetical protein ACD_3C00236G0002 [uncultured bacterium (gcode 4)]
MFNPNKKAFTLVELIVVIVILSILATIAFLSFSSQSSSARDSTRLADMSNIAKWLTVYNAISWNYPKPDSSNIVTITASWTTIWYQWYAWPTVLGIAKLSNWWKDPLDQTYYTYATNASQSRFQLLWFLEDWSNVVLSYMPHEIPAFAGMTEGWVYADPSSYSGRYVFTKWDQLWVLLSSWSLTPIQLSWTGADVITSTWWTYKAIISNKLTLSWTWPSLWELNWRYDTSAWIYPGCDSPNIKLPNGQIWSACNVGASNTWNNQIMINNCWWIASDCDSWVRNILWSYFQWWRNDDVTSSASTWTLAATWTLSNNVWNNNFIYHNGGYYDWLPDWTQNPNLWWWSGTTFTAWTYNSQWSPSLMQWPCASGYHVPTQYELWTAVSNINPNLINNTVYQPDTSVATVLKLSLSWNRNAADAWYYYQWARWYYWTSSPAGTVSFPLFLDTTRILITSSSYERWNAFSVRCLKN